jgi:hypothetical protein
VIKIYRKVNDIWTVVRYGCPNCEKNYKTVQYAQKHIEQCRINTIKRLDREELKNMPIQAIMRNGKRYYRWGDTGKLYEKREDAEAQARAAYASGYKENERKASEMDGIQIRYIDRIEKFKPGNKT